MIRNKELLKASFTDATKTKINYPNHLGRSKHTRIMAIGLEYDYFIGSKEEEDKEFMNINYSPEQLKTSS